MTIAERATAGGMDMAARRPGEAIVDRTPRFPRKPKRISGRSIAILVFLTICALFFCVPLYVVLTTSFKTMDQIRLGEVFSLPHPFTIDPWLAAWGTACSGVRCEGIKGGFLNSLWILAPSLVISITLSAVTGYALALWNVRWANAFLFVLFMCCFVPFQVIMIPLIVITSTIKIYGTLWGIAVMHGVLGMPILTLIFRNYYKGIPQEIMSAALMDSGSFWRIFGEIVLPMSGNILVVVLVLQITSIWNDFLIGLTFGGLGTQPISVMLANMVVTTTGVATYNQNMAAAVLTAVPPLVIYFVLGKLFVQGITSGAIKG